MKQQKAPNLYYVILLCCAVLCFPMGMFCKQSKPEPKQPLIIGDSNEPALVIEVVYWLQAEVGAKQDAVIGPETTRLVNTQSKKDEPVYFNKQAARFYTPSGGPRKEK